MMQAQSPPPAMPVKAAPTALVADDEPLLRERLIAHLQRAWPELQVVAQARNGREAVELFDEAECAISPGWSVSLTPQS